MKIIVGFPEKMIFIDEDAFFKLTRDRGELYIVKNSILFKVSCQTGINKDGKIRVIEGLINGDRIVIDPAPFLREGMKITIVEAEGESL